MSTIHVVTGLPGQGKTYAGIKLAAEYLLHGDNVLYALPTIQALQEATRKYQPSYPNIEFVEVFSQRGQSASQQLIRLMKAKKNLSPDSKPQLILCTHQVLDYIPKAFIDSVKPKWILIHDEVPAIIYGCNHNLSKTHKHITSHSDIEPYNAIYSKVVSTNNIRIEEVARNDSDDEVYDMFFKEAARCIQSEYWTVFTNSERHRKLINGEAKQLPIYAVKGPALYTGWKKTYLLAANIYTAGCVYKIWSSLGVQFKIDERLQKSLRKINGKVLRIIAPDQKSWGKQRALGRSENGSDGQLVDLSKIGVTTFGDRDFLWAANKKANVPAGHDANNRAPMMPHSVCEYEHLTGCAYYTAVNLTPDLREFLISQPYGLTEDDIREGFAGEHCLQTIGRTAIRRPDNTETITAVIPNVKLAKFVAKCFGSDDVATHREDWIPGHLRSDYKPRTKREYQREYQRKYDEPKRQEARKAKLEALYQSKSRVDDTASKLLRDAQGVDEIALNKAKINGLGPLKWTYNVGQTLSTPPGFISRPRTSGNATIDLSTSKQFQAAVYGSIFSHNVLGLAHETLDDYVARLQSPGIYGRSFATKDERNSKCGLISAVLYADTSRKAVDAQYMNGIWFDFEDGDLTAEELPKLFPEYRLVVCNSYRHTKEKQRFHAFLPFKRTISAEFQESIFDLFIDKLRDAGYYTPRGKGRPPKDVLRSGLDTSKRERGRTMFYLPCQAEQPEHSFFVDYKDGRSLCDAYAWIENSAESPVYARREPIIVEQQRTVDPKKVDEAVATWRTWAGATIDGKNHEFFQLGRALRYAGLGWSEIEEHLRHEAKIAPVENTKRRKQVNGIVDWLQRHIN